MNNDIIKGQWKMIKGNIKKQWGKLTDDDLTQMEGSFDELKGTLQKRYGFNEEMAKKEIDNFIKNHKLESRLSDITSQVKLSKSEKHGKRKAA